MTGRIGVRLIVAALSSGNLDVELDTPAGTITASVLLDELAAHWLDEVERTLTAVVPPACDEERVSRISVWHSEHPEALVGDLVAVGSGLVPEEVDLGGCQPGALMSAGPSAAVLKLFCRGKISGLGEPVPCVQDIFVDIAKAHPGRTAVVTADGRTTFAELETLSRLLAHRLRQAGAGPGSVTAVLAPRDSNLVVAMLAVLRAGSAFLLVDPNDPAELSKYKVDIASAAVLWRDDRCDIPWDATDALQVVVGLGGDDAEHLPKAHQSDLAYVVFTSGTTGRPKGAQIEHRGLTEHALTQLAPIYENWGEDAPLRVGGAAPITFDSFIDQVLPTLAFGHTLILFDDRQRTDPESFLKPQHGVELDVVDCTPSQLSVLVAQGLLEQPHPPKLVVFAGEKPSQGLWTRLRTSGTRAVSIYGATECSIGSLHAELDDFPEVCLGLPEGSARVYVLDDRKRLLPPGIAGELYLGGPGVGHGYVGHSNEAFGDDPFAGEVGSRMYRTGDLGRIGLTRVFEYLGRADGQVKIRGFRVEPGEVEAVLEDVHGIEHAVVLPAPPAGPHTHLVAFLVNSADGPDWLAVREQASWLLADHMVPARAEFRDELPLTRNGKVDRAALSGELADRMNHRQGGDGEGPANAIEKLVLDTWVDVLGIEAAGVTDDFLALGGHSLAAMEIVTRLRSALPQRIPMAVVLRARTVRRQAAAIQECDEANV